MHALIWVRGLLARRPLQIAATATGVAIAVALIASIGAFLSATTATMTRRAAARVAVDWQVQARRPADAARVLTEARRAPGMLAALPVGFAPTPGLSARTGGTVQQTGPGRVVGLPAGYSKRFPGQLRLLTGRLDGPLLAQQTAANLHVTPGGAVTVARPGARPVRVRIAGVVDLPAADALFQRVGAGAAAQPRAAPDNVVLLPLPAFTRLERGTGRTTIQIHVRLAHDLPASPQDAFTLVTGRAMNLEARLAGEGRVGDNLAAALDTARGDAVYAQLLFLFLGLPGAVIAGLLTAFVASASASSRRRDLALLRARGARVRQMTALAAAETAVGGGAGVLLGLAAALAIGRLAFGTASFGADTTSATLWAAGAALVGLVVAAGSVAVPAWRDARSLSVLAQGRAVERGHRMPVWARLGLDVAALAAAALVFWSVTRSGYQLVLAPEGVPQVSIDRLGLLAPALAWIGGGLLAHRVAGLALRRGRAGLRAALAPMAGSLAPIVAATMSRQSRLLARALTLVALTAAFAGSTAVFDATYRHQAGIDARLTSGGDVTVTESPGRSTGPSAATALGGIPGVRGVEPLQHRYAYVGPDLQDLYGVRPATIVSAGRLQDAWFSGGTAAGLAGVLARRPDAVLVSAETVHDFQLRPGDLLRLRLQDGRTKRFRIVPFRYAGVVKEFPTAPTDSFLVANAGYVARATGSDAVGTFLLQTDGTSPPAVAARVRRLVGTTASVTDVSTARRVVGSNLTAVSLSGLTRVELGFALLLAAAASGLALLLGFRERRRTFAIARALGASPRQLGAFVWGEATFVAAGGILLGAALAAGLSWMLVSVLTGVFDPPPDTTAVPWRYLLSAAAVAVLAAAGAALATIGALTRAGGGGIREG